MDRRLNACLLLAGLAGAGSGQAQMVIRDNELLATDRPEAWAMNHALASTLLTAFGAPPTLAPGRWSFAAEMGHVPHLDARQRQVGFNGLKSEDLNKSPVFGRLRFALGLPAGWRAELAYTPPITIDGSRAQALFAAALSHPVWERERWRLTARVFGQHGSARGDITCPAELAGIADLARNPYGCQSASDDRIALNHYGVSLVTGFGAGDWRWHAELGVVRTEPEVRVDARVFDVRDRSRLVARDLLPMLAFGVGRDFSPRWRWSVELLHVPLTVRRDPGAGAHVDGFSSLRVQLAYEP